MAIINTQVVIYFLPFYFRWREYIPIALRSLQITECNLMLESAWNIRVKTVR